MQQLSNKRILLGITGGIAAYKAAELVRRLKEHGAEVRVVMTQGAMAFITPLTLQALSGNPVHHTLLDPEAEAGMGHIELARWADIVLVAPASANFIARMAEGKGDDLLTTLILATHAPVAVAPAMNQGMWDNPATSDNIETLRSRHVAIFGPGSGSQACGEVGPGRMLEADELARLTAEQFQTGLLSGLRVTITAGPTREAIDPVRYISNHSSGKMGYALAEACADAGAITTLLSGPTSLPTPERVNRVNVESACEMLEAALSESPKCDIFIACAAVADYRPVNTSEQKIKKTSETLTIELVKNPDIVSAIAAQEPGPWVVGFAAETRNVAEYARDKLTNKNLDLIIANDVSGSETGFNSEENEVLLIWKGGEKPLERASKRQLAQRIIAEIASLYPGKAG